MSRYREPSWTVIFAFIVLGIVLPSVTYVINNAGWASYPYSLVRTKPFFIGIGAAASIVDWVGVVALVYIKIRAYF